MSGKRPKKKVVLFLVEGDSEKKALKDVISSLYDSIDPEILVYFPMIIEDDYDVRGDITSKYGITPDTIERCIYKLFLSNFFDQEKILPKDVTEIIHIIDLDGAYVNDNQVILNPSASKTIYNLDNIMTNNVAKIIDRNQRKRSNIDYLCSLSNIHVKQKTPPYSAYFFSSNLDHFLFGDANIQSGKDKVDKAEKFSMEYSSNPENLIKFVKSKTGGLDNMSYSDSWSFIRQRGNNSLNPHTNINLLFDRLVNNEE